MHLLGGILGLGLIVLTLADGFETILQPRRVMHRFRFARLFYRHTWALWRGAARLLRTAKRREAFVSLYGPLSLLGLFAFWVFLFIVGFALLQWSLRSPLHSPDAIIGFGTDLYLSGTTFFTLGYGDVTPTHPLGRALAVIESGLGFGSLAVMISYLPVLYQAYSLREVTISLLDARAGSPPSAGQFLLRLVQTGKIDDADRFLLEWERWSAELLESHLSFPVLSYYRSQHDNQSWLATLTMILDACALLMSHGERQDTYQAQLTFAMARHAAVDLVLVFKIRPSPPAQDRFTPEQYARLQEMLLADGLQCDPLADANKRLSELRGMYEPFVNALAERFMLALPAINPQPYIADNWQRSGWMQRTPGIGHLPGTEQDEHFR